MRRLLFFAVTVLTAALVILAVPTEAEGAIYRDTVRLHIRAASDEKEDQATKLAVRDRVLELVSAELSGGLSRADAEEVIRGMLGEIKTVAEGVVRERGYTYGVTVSLGEEYFPTREYEGFTLPSGTYTSLVIELGGGEGQNWWCVMYPPLCLGASVDDSAVAYSDSEVRLIRGDGLKVKFKTLELYSKYFG